MPQETEVLFNDTCPICSREVRHYERLSQQAGLAVVYDPLSGADTQAQWGLDADTAAKRLHLRRGGQIFSGIPAFILLWREIPQYRWLARLISLPGVHWLACKVYDHILAPLLFKMHQRRMAHAKVNKA